MRVIEINSTIFCVLFLTSLASSLTVPKLPKNTIKGNIGAPCVSDDDCSEDALGSVCLPSADNFLIKFCVCSGDGVEEPDGNCFTTPEQLGDRCKVSDPLPCPMTNSICTPNPSQVGYGICECSQGFFEFARQCEAMPTKLGDKCSETNQCLGVVEFTLCGPSGPDTPGNCQCQTLYAQDDDKCYPEKLELPCTDDSQCAFSLGSSVCISPDPEKPTEKYCDCSEAYPNDDMDFCFRYASDIGDPCVELKQCAQLFNASTVQCAIPSAGGPQACICKSDSVISSVVLGCVPLVGYGEACTEENQCGENVAGVHCQSAVCRCEDNYLPGPDKCYLLADQIGQPCEVQFQCTEKLENATCGVGGFCSCPEGVADSGLTNTRCLSKYLEGFVCQSDDECLHIPFSKCLPPFDDNPDQSRRCRCDEDMDIVGSANREKCLLPAVLVGDECELDSQCKLIVGSECKVGPGGAELTCQCKQYMEPDPSNTRCIEEPPTK